MRIVDEVPQDFGHCLGTPSDEGCTRPPVTYVLATNDDTRQVALLGVCYWHEQYRDEIQGFLVAAGFREGFGFSRANLPAAIAMLQEILDGGSVVGEAHSSWSELSAVG